MICKSSTPHLQSCSESTKRAFPIYKKSVLHISYRTQQSGIKRLIYAILFKKSVGERPVTLRKLAHAVVRERKPT